MLQTERAEMDIGDTLEGKNFDSSEDSITK